jgi:hypothetical protein
VDVGVEVHGEKLWVRLFHRRLLWQQAVLDSAAAIAEPSELRKLSIFEKIKNPKSFIRFSEF